MGLLYVTGRKRRKDATGRKRCTVCLLAAVMLVNLWVLPVTAEVGVDPLEGYGDYIVSLMEETNIPGAAVAIVRGEEVIFQEGFGVRDLEGGIPVDGDTLFPIGSASKAFTATQLAMLVDGGKMSWDTPVRQYLPNFAVADEKVASLLSPRDLLSHRAGLPRYDFTLIYNPGMTREGIVDKFHSVAPVAGFRNSFLYSNYGYIIAGHLGEVLTGMTWEEGVRQMILDPLGMERSNSSLVEMFGDANHARGYYESPGEGLVEAPYWHLGVAGPAGSLNSSAAEMARWLKFNLGTGGPGEAGLVSPMGLSFVQSPVNALTGRVDPYFSQISYGLGWIIETYRGHYHVYHGGNVPGYSANVSLLPEEGIGVVVLSSGDGSLFPQVAAYEALDRLLGLEPVDWGKSKMQEMEEVLLMLGDYALLNQDLRVKDSWARPLADYTGRYSHPLFGDIIIRDSGNGLEGAYYDKVSSSLEHWHFDVFLGKFDYTSYGFEFVFNFTRDLDGRVTGLQVDLDPFSTAHPVTFTRDAAPVEGSPAPDKGTLEELAGDYQVMGSPVYVRLTDGGEFFLYVPGQPMYFLEHLQGLRFRFQGLEGYQVEFLPEQRRIILIQPEGTFSGERVE